MGSNQKIVMFWRRLNSATRLAIIAAGSVVVLALLCAGLAYRRAADRKVAQFAEHATAVGEMTREALLADAAAMPQALLQRYFQLETRAPTLDYAALIIGPQIEIAHSLDWQDLEATQVLGPATWDAIAGLSPEETGVPRRNNELDRQEAVTALPFGTADRPVLLYLALDGAEIAAAGAARAWAVLRNGLLIALGVGVVTYLRFQRSMGSPLQQLEDHLDQVGLPVALAGEELGELGRLAGALEDATQRLLKDEEGKQDALQRALERTTAESEVQTGVLQHMVKDLRSAMSAILGHAELLLASDTNPADRINHIRSIQKEARRISRLVRELQDLLPPIEAIMEAAERAELPLDRLREMIEQLSQSGSATLHFSKPETRRSGIQAAEPSGGVERSGWNADADEPSKPERLSGSALLLGRQDDIMRGLLSELHEMGLDAVWVPDHSAFETEVTRSGCDLVFVNLSRGDRRSRELAGEVREHYPSGPLIAVLPQSARGAGRSAIGQGFDDYLYAPANRRAILAVIGKYMGFKPLERGPG